MFPYLIGIKSNMTHVFNESGVRVAATKVKILPSWVTRVSKVGDLQNIQVGYSQGKHVNKPQAMVLSKLEIKEPLTDYVEFRVAETEDMIAPGAQVSPEFLNPGDMVDVQGITKGKGFAGVVKRWGFAGGPKTHGQSDRHRAPGSIGSGTTMGRVLKGLKMGGKMGSEKQTIPNLTVLGVNLDENELILSGSIPGPTGAVVYIEKIGSKKNFVSIPSLTKAVVEEETENVSQETEEK